VKRRPEQHGQVTAELALLMPFVLVMVLAVAQIVVIWRTELLVTHAARAAVRAATVSPDVGAMHRAAALADGLDSARLQVVVVERGDPGDIVTVRVSYGPVDRLPIVGVATRAVVVSASASMLVES
jgi:phosphoribosylpyrophosphate synthetase